MPLPLVVPIAIAAVQLAGSAINAFSQHSAKNRARDAAREAAKKEKRSIKKDIRRLDRREDKTLKRFGEFAAETRSMQRAAQGAYGLAGRTPLAQRNQTRKRLRRQRSDIKTEFSDARRGLKKQKGSLSDYMDNLKPGNFLEEYGPLAGSLLTGFGQAASTFVRLGGVQPGQPAGPGPGPLPMAPAIPGAGAGFGTYARQLRIGGMS